MIDYELTLVLSADLSSEDQKKLIEKIKKTIEEQKGKIEKQEDWGKKELAYPIKKKKMGFYFWWEAKLDPESLSKIDKKLKMEEEVLRYLILRKE
ncbi:30S ribosomal protein S6 [Candidatus Shapirobacteria bacterium]|nr:30S ribosomal protein S6 [Candidatus Shapirobacteria bacterium]